MSRTAEQLKRNIEVYEQRLAALRKEMEEVTKPKPGDVFLDQDGVVYIATNRLGASSEVVLWNIGGCGWNKTGAYHGSLKYWEKQGKQLTRALAGGMESQPFNVLLECGVR